MIVVSTTSPYVIVSLLSFSLILFPVCMYMYVKTTNCYYRRVVVWSPSDVASFLATVITQTMKTEVEHARRAPHFITKNDDSSGSRSIYDNSEAEPVPGA